MVPLIPIFSNLIPIQYILFHWFKYIMWIEFTKILENAHKINNELLALIDGFAILTFEYVHFFKARKLVA